MANFSDISGEVDRVQFEEELIPVGPPVGPLIGAAALIVVSAVLLVPASDAVQLAGYLLAALGVPILIIGFRSMVRRRQSSTTFIDLLWTRFAAVALLVVAIAIAVWHAWLFAQTEVLV